MTYFISGLRSYKTESAATCFKDMENSRSTWGNYFAENSFFSNAMIEVVQPYSVHRLKSSPMVYRTRFSLLFVLLFILSISPSHSAASILEGIVVKVADGDTISVIDSDKVQHRVRIAGIDAPEKYQSFGNASGKPLGELVAIHSATSPSTPSTVTRSASFSE